jgi:hypothetical protein
MKTASFNAFTSSPMAMQHPLAKNQKALGQSQREGLSILRPVNPPEFDKLRSLNHSACKPTSLGNTVRVPLEEGNTFTDAEDVDSEYYRRKLNKTKESKLILRDLSEVLDPHGLDIGMATNPDRSQHPWFTPLIIPKRLKKEKSRFVIPLPGIKDASQVETRFNQPERTAKSIIDELRRVFPKEELKIILEGLTGHRNPLDVLISGLSSK